MVTISRDNKNDKIQNGNHMKLFLVSPVFQGPVGCQRRVEHGVIDGRAPLPMPVHLPL